MPVETLHATSLQKGVYESDLVSVLPPTKKSTYSNQKITRKTHLKNCKNSKISSEFNHHWHHNLGKFLLGISIALGFGGFGFGFGIRSGKTMPISINVNQTEQSVYK